MVKGRGQAQGHPLSAGWQVGHGEQPKGEMGLCKLSSLLLLRRNFLEEGSSYCWP